MPAETGDETPAEPAPESTTDGRAAPALRAGEGEEPAEAPVEAPVEAPAGDPAEGPVVEPPAVLPEGEDPADVLPPDLTQLPGAAGGLPPDVPADVAEAFGALQECTLEVQEAAATAAPEDYVVACSEPITVPAEEEGAEPTVFQQKYVLEPAVLEGTAVDGADALIDTAQGGTGEWVVTLDFTGEASNIWGDVTTENVGRQVAVALDGLVVSAPVINGPILGGTTQITGDFEREEAQNLANVLRFGALPLTFERSQAETISPALGTDQLETGLIAGGIGMALVVLYLLAYYRGLGLVACGTLVFAALLTYELVVLLGQYAGYRLSLAGIVGLIVSIGITADSFVVYLERVKDEVREGRSAAAAADRAWIRARQTIISADVVQLLAAVVLYLISVGAVRGFAFTLGLVTVIDLVVAFLFIRPLVSAVVRSRRLSAPWFTGLGRESIGPRRRAGGAEPTPTPTTTTATAEAR